jgi:hypothetical protein
LRLGPVPHVIQLLFLGTLKGCPRGVGFRHLRDPTGLHSRPAGASQPRPAGASRGSMLERLLEQSKPPPRAAARDLHYLLSTPFRYSSAWS